MTDIFISYAREDLDRVRPIVNLIEDNGWSVFWDRTIPPGLTWREYIGKALGEAKCLIVVWSRNSVKSEFVQEEADDGRERKILIPIIIDNARPPLGFRAIQHEDFTKWKGEPDNRRAKSLIKAIEGIAGKPPKGLTEPSVKPKSEAEQTAEPPKPKNAAESQNAAKTAELEPLESKSWIKKPKKSPTVKIGMSIVMFVAIVVLILLFRKEAILTVNVYQPKMVDQDLPVATQSSVTAPPKKFTNAVDMEFVLISAGNFTMGGDDGYDFEKPIHQVKISKPFYFQTTEVTQGQWEKVMGDNSSGFKYCGDDCPVDSVSWDDTQEFINKLNDMEGTDTYRLPTEAEWEYAARAGTTTKFSFGDDASQLDEYGWNNKNSSSLTHPVGGKKPNPWGLYDVHGNVWEWVEDDWHDNYDEAPADGRAWIDKKRGTDRVRRGGGWNVYAEFCRSAMRAYSAHYYGSGGIIGFRLARSVDIDP